MRERGQWTPRQKYRRMIWVCVAVWVIPFIGNIVSTSAIRWPFTLMTLVLLERTPEGTLRSITWDQQDDAVTMVAVVYSVKMGSIGPLEFWTVEVTPRTVGDKFMFQWPFPTDEHGAALAAAAEGVGRDITRQMKVSTPVVVPPESMAIGQTITIERMPWIYDALVFAKWPTKVVYYGMWVCIIVIGWRSGRLEKGSGCRHCGHGQERRKGLKCTECGCDTAVV
ncbi:MAG: hypothetical protein IBJ18_08845 [Phycisphaerales bacterium]|nr:hypothetical protein [Phycisphaerales bacterium]